MRASLLVSACFVAVAAGDLACGSSEQAPLAAQSPDGGDVGRSDATVPDTSGDTAQHDAASAEASSPDAPSGSPADSYLPWEGGPSYYARFTHGPPSDPTFFPIAVWLQSPSNAAAYKAIGINSFIGLWEGPTDAQLSDLKAAGVPALCDQSGAWSSHLTDSTIVGWTHQDEPDNAQSDGHGGYGPCIPTSAIVSEYDTFRSRDGTRPVYLNLGQGVAYDDYIGRGSECGGKLDMYPEYEKGADIVSFDIYPVNSTDTPVHDNLWLVARGVDRLRTWSSYTKMVWNWIETTGFNDPSHAPTPAQVKTEVWMSLVHGSMGIGYFAHVFKPTFVEAGLLADKTMRDAVHAINQQINDLAPALNTPSLADAVTVSSSDPGVPVDTMVKRVGDALYLFAVAMRPGPTTAGFTLKVAPSHSVEVLGESRQLTASAGAFTDAFASYAVHLYRITP